MRRNLLLASAAVAVFFGLLELGLRLSGRIPTEQLRTPAIEKFDALPGMFEPHQDFVDRVLPDLAYHVRTNTLGFRGEEVALAKAPGTVRVLALGDSYAFGPYVQDDETYPAQLERALRAMMPEGAPAVEVINGGASGFTIEDEMTFLREKAIAVDPDLIVLVYCQNDVLDLGRAKSTIETMRDHARLKSTFVIGPALRLLQDTAIFNGMQLAAAYVKVLKMRAQPYLTSDSATPEEWRRYRELLGQFVDYVRGRGVRLLMVVWISADQISGKATMGPQQKLEGFARELGFETLDLAPSIRRLNDSGVNPYFVPIDGHPNARGYQTAAEATARRLIDLGYLAPAPLRPQVP